MVTNVRLKRRRRADESGRMWWVGSYRRNDKQIGRWRVFLNGRDVSDLTFYTDARRGVVRMYAKNAEGLWLFDGDDIKTTEKRGRVKLRRREAA